MIDYNKISKDGNVYYYTEIFKDKIDENYFKNLFGDIKEHQIDVRSNTSFGDIMNSINNIFQNGCFILTLSLITVNEHISPRVVFKYVELPKFFKVRVKIEEDKEFYRKIYDRLQ
jgi:hypothetical protein